MAVSTVKRLDPFAESYDLDGEDLTPKVIPISFKGRKYELREASADDALKWRAATLLKMAPNPDGGGLVPVSGFHDNEAHILSLCLWDVTDSPEGKRLNLYQIRNTFPYRFMEPLSERAKDISGITPNDESAELLEKRISLLQKRLDELRAAKEEKREPESPEGNGQAGTEEY
jgi:hypothetical protein